MDRPAAIDAVFVDVLQWADCPSEMPGLMPAVEIPPRDTTFAVAGPVIVCAYRLPSTIPLTDDIARLDFRTMTQQGDRQR